jgi:hypothetical protein
MLSNKYIKNKTIKIWDATICTGLGVGSYPHYNFKIFPPPNAPVLPF